MCEVQREPDIAGALAMLDRALTVLAACDAASLPAGQQAEMLRALERAQSRHTVARARTLAGFIAQDGCREDGQGSARTWLRWQTRITRRAAVEAAGWVRRLQAHPVIARALAAGELSQSWARHVCAWTDRLPEDAREEADTILVRAARDGAELTDLAALAEEIYQRTAGPDQDDDGFGDRHLSLGTTFRGAGRLTADLTPGCATALDAVLEALGRKAGPEDTRTAGQRRHDALEEACRRLIAARMVPGRAGQPTHIQLHMTLGQLRSLPGAPAAERAWAAARATEPGWLTGSEADAAACDATLIPVVTGHLDPGVLDRLTGAAPGRTTPSGTTTGQACRCACGGCSCPAGGQPLSAAAQRRLRRALLALAAGLLSGPGGLASLLRTGLAGPALAGPALAGPALATVSLPLDIGAASEIIPAHLRRAVTTRHRHCAFPGCDQPASVCQIHHLVPRARGGPTALANLVPLCAFHHLITIHRWGWTLVLNPDGTTTATSPDGSRSLHSHSPPANAA